MSGHAQVPFPDHMAISIKLDIYANNRGKGYFKMNNSILTDTQYNELINKLIEKYEQNFNLTNVLNQWDLLKTDIRESTIQYCKSKARERKNNILIMENKLNLLNERLDKLPDRLLLIKVKF